MYSKKLIDEIDRLWQNHPDQNIGQLLLNLTRHPGVSDIDHRLWNMTTEDLLDEIDLL